MIADGKKAHENFAGRVDAMQNREVAEFWSEQMREMQEHYTNLHQLIQLLRQNGNS